jgi:hypothetical protein
MRGVGYNIGALALRQTNTGAAGAPFSPLDYGPSVFFDPRKTGSLFQDSAASSAVTGDGQPVGMWKDQTPNGNDLMQTNAAARPMFHNNGTDQWIETDGVNDALITAPVFDLAHPTTMILGYQMLSTSGNSRVNLAEISWTSTNGMSLGARPSVDRLQYYSRLSAKGVPATRIVAPVVVGGHTRHVVTMQSVPGNVTARLDGQTVFDAPQAWGTQSIAAKPLRVGVGYVTSSISGAFRIFGLQVWGQGTAQPSLAQIEVLENWMADQMGISI